MRSALTLTFCFATLLLAGGCAGKSGTASSGDREVTIAPEPDLEAARLGFPDKFVSKESKPVDWSKVPQTKIDGLPAQVVKGSVVEVCGGNCDK